MNETGIKVKRIIKIIATIIFWVILTPKMVLIFMDKYPRRQSSFEINDSVNTYELINPGDYPIFDCASGVEFGLIRIVSNENNSMYIELESEDFFGYYDLLEREYEFSSVSFSNIFLTSRISGKETIFGDSGKYNVLLSHIKNSKYGKPIPEIIYNPNYYYFFVGMFDDNSFSWYSEGNIPMLSSEAMVGDFYRSKFSGFFFVPIIRDD